MKKKAIKHLLVIRSSAMGDVAMTVPVLLAFRAQYPEVKITLLTQSVFEPFFSQISNLEVKFFETKAKHNGILGLQQLAEEIKQESIDAIADLHNVLRTKVLKSLLVFTSIPFVQIDKGRAAKKALTRWDKKVFKPLKTTHQRYVEVFKSLGFELENTKKRVFTLNKEVLTNEVQNLVGKNTQKWIGLAPFAAHQGKVYPLEQLKKVIAALNSTNKYKLFLFGGGKKEIDQLAVLEKEFDHVTSVAGKLNLKQELNLISNLDIMVSMDSGNGHIAAMYGIPVITIWGVTHPHAGFAPYNQPSQNNIIPNLERYPKIPTSVYGNKYPEGYEKVMYSISSQIVLDKIIQVLN